MGRKLNCVLLAVVMVAAACGGAGASEPRVEGDPADLIGTWVSGGGITMVVGEDTIMSSGGSVIGTVESRYTADGFTLEMNDIAGEQTCAEIATGTYEWEIVDGVLDFELTSDACGGRAAIMRVATYTME